MTTIQIIRKEWKEIILAFADAFTMMIPISFFLAIAYTIYL